MVRKAAETIGVTTGTLREVVDMVHEVGGREMQNVVAPRYLLYWR